MTSEAETGLAATISESQRRFLVDLWAYCGERELSDGAEDLPDIKALVAKELIRLSPGRCGPLGVPSGTVFAQITEAGRAAIATAGSVQS